MAASSDGYLFFRTSVGSDLTTGVLVATGATGSGTIVTVRNATSQINVQRIRIIPTTHGVGSITFTETDATGALVAIVLQNSGTGAGAGEQSSFVDFGPKGLKMGVNKSLFYNRSSATGPGGQIIVEAYGTASTSGPLAIATTN